MIRSITLELYGVDKERNFISCEVMGIYDESKNTLENALKSLYNKEMKKHVDKLSTCDLSLYTGSFDGDLSDIAVVKQDKDFDIGCETVLTIDNSVIKFNGEYFENILEL